MSSQCARNILRGIIVKKGEGLSWELKFNSKRARRGMSPFGKPKLITDLNGDGKVDIIDIALVVKAFCSYPGHPR